MNKKMKLKIFSALIVTTIISQIGAIAYASGNNAFSVGADFPNDTVDTRSAATSAASKLGTMGYDSYYSTAPTYDILGGNFADDGHRRLHSDVVYLNGHGTPTSVVFPNTGLRVGRDDGYYYRGTDDFHWANVDLAILVACNTSMYGDSIAYRLNWGGATTCIGFPDTVYTSAGKTWTDRFLDKLALGSTVNEAKDYANSGLFVVGGTEIRKATVIGNGELRINGSTLRTLKNILQSKNSNEGNIEIEKNVFKVNNNIEYKTEYRNGKNINIAQNIIFENNVEGKKNIIKLLEDNIENFDINNYEMDIQLMNNGEGDYAIELHYKIGEYYTNSGFVIMIKNNKVSNLIDYTIDNSNIDSIENGLEIYDGNYFSKNVKRMENKAMLEVNKKYNSSAKVLDSKLFYDLVENKKYILTNVESKIKDAVAIETIISEI